MKGKTNVEEASIATVANDGARKKPNNVALAFQLGYLVSKVFAFTWKRGNKMEEGKLGRRERRRRKMEGNQLEEYEFEKTVENSEFSTKTHVTQSLGKLTRRDTYTVLHSKSDFDVAKVDDVEEDFHVKSEGSGNNSTQSRNLTYSLNKDSDTSNHCTYNIDKPPDSEIRPVPAPRRCKSTHVETEKVSSDTDRDITEIDLDDLRVRSPKSDLSSKPSPISNKSLSSEPIFDDRRNDLTVPVPKPRKTVTSQQKPNSENSKNSEADSPTEMSNSNEKHTKSEMDSNLKIRDEQPESNELPLISDLQDEAKSDEVRQKPKKQKKLIGDLLDRKGRKKKSKTFSSLMKLEKKKMPKISSILKDLKEDEGKEGKPEAEEDKMDFQIDSPRYKESAQNGQIYVQGKNGFHMKKRDEVLRSGNDTLETDGNGGIMEDSNVKTAVLFQKFWSSSMTYLHGVLAGIGFSHAATVTAIMLHYNYDPKGFISVYSCLSLKIHYVFYALTALCIVSSFDRVDIGHMNRRHWDNALKSPSTWVVLALYLISFALTFVNQKSEARFDALPGANETEIWDGQSQSDIQVSLLQWYHAVWARDMLVLLAWLLIALTKFEDLLHSHINNMAKYANIKEEQAHRHKTEYF